MKTDTTAQDKMIRKLAYEMRNTRVNSAKWHDLNDTLRKIHVALITVKA